MDGSHRIVCVDSFIYKCMAAPKLRLYAEQDSKPKIHRTDIEVELHVLLRIMLKYKMKKSTERFIWEFIIKKYNDVLVLFQKALSSTCTPGDACGKDYPHKPDAVNKSNLSTTVLVKNIRIEFQQAVNSG